MTDNHLPQQKIHENHQHTYEIPPQDHDRESISKFIPGMSKKTDNSIEIFNIQDIMLQRDKNTEVIVENSPSKKLDETNIEFMSAGEPNNNTCNINAKSIRRNFIRKVLVILACQFFSSMLMIILSIFVHKINAFILDHLYLVIVACFLEISFFITLICFRPFCKKVPHNYIILFLFTFSMSYILCFMCVIISEVAVLIASISTGVLVMGLAVFSACSQRDLTTKIALIIYIPIAGLLIIVFASAFPVYITQLFVSLIIVMIFGIYLMYDIQKLLGRFDEAYTIDDYIIAALEIYVDVVFIFKELLIVIGSVASK